MPSTLLVKQIVSLDTSYPHSEAVTLHGWATAGKPRPSTALTRRVVLQRGGGQAAWRRSTSAVRQCGDGVGDALEHVSRLPLRIQAVELGGSDRAGHGSGALATRLRSRQQIVVAPQSDAAQATLSRWSCRSRCDHCRRSMSAPPSLAEYRTVLPRSDLYEIATSA